MSTYKTKCIICGKDCLCTADEHALGCGGQNGEGGCENPPFIEFCSIEHAIELQHRIIGSITNFYTIQLDEYKDSAVYWHKQATK